MPIKPYLLNHRARVGPKKPHGLLRAAIWTSGRQTVRTIPNSVEMGLSERQAGVKLGIGWSLGRRDQIVPAHGAGQFATCRMACANAARRQSPGGKKHEFP